MIATLLFEGMHPSSVFATGRHNDLCEAFMTKALHFSDVEAHEALAARSRDPAPQAVFSLIHAQPFKPPTAKPPGHYDLDCATHGPGGTVLLSAESQEFHSLPNSVLLTRVRIRPGNARHGGRGCNSFGDKQYYVFKDDRRPQQQHQSNSIGKKCSFCWKPGHTR